MLPSLASRWKTSSPGAQQAPSAATSSKPVDARILRTQCSPYLLPQSVTGFCVAGEWTQPGLAGSDEGATRQSLGGGGGASFHPLACPLRQRHLELRSLTYSFISAVIKHHLLCLFLGTERKRQGPYLSLKEETGNRCDHAGWYVLRGELFSSSEPYFSVWLL